MRTPPAYVAPRLDGKVALVTGANSGLGLEIAEILAQHGARVLLACRNPTKAGAAAEHIRRSTVDPVAVEVVALDLADLASVDRCAEGVLGAEERLDVLVNNAGLMAVDEAMTADGFEMQLGVNHLGHFALTARLAPLVLSTPGSRVVSMSSFGHRLGRLHLDDLFFDRRGYRRWPPYFQSKLANLLFTAELHRRLDEAASTTMALAAHPGASHTDLGHEGAGLTNKLMKPAMATMQSAAAGALPLVRAATDPSAKSGEFYGPRLMFRGAPRRETPSRRARNADDARALWEKSEELTGLPFSIPAV
ncbi:MAG TPA: oxidoreductase [Acidimicrobiales bacterium]|nr:oxidoreductase [Acidimicrobiales bacterium]